MRSNQMKERQTRSGSGHRRLIPWVLAGAMIPALVGAQSQNATQSSTGPMVTVLKSAQYSVFAGHTFVVRVNDVGSKYAATEVTLEIRDGDDKRRAFKSVVLRGRQSVELPLRIETGRGLFRALVMLTPIAFGELSQPFAIVEDIDPNSFTVESKPPCPVGQQPEVPSGAEGDCGGGWRMNRLTLEQASNSLD
jgi:hypothetical protein